MTGAGSRGHSRTALAMDEWPRARHIKDTQDGRVFCASCASVRGEGALQFRINGMGFGEMRFCESDSAGAILL